MRRNVFERLKICWYILTKKEYAFWAYNKPIYRHTGSVCYISNINDKLFLETIQEHLIKILENGQSLHPKGWSLSKGKRKEKKTRNLSNDHTE